jgi:hypothetical protein
LSPNGIVRDPVTSAAHAAFRTPDAWPAMPGPLTGLVPPELHGAFFDMVSFPFCCPVPNTVLRAPIRNKRNV